VSALCGGEHLRDSLVADVTVGLDSHDAGCRGGLAELLLEAPIVIDRRAVPEDAAVEIDFDVCHECGCMRGGGRGETTPRRSAAISNV
jgi:hypothetical protein